MGRKTCYTIINAETVERHNPRPNQPTKNQRKLRLEAYFHVFHCTMFNIKPNFTVGWSALGRDIRRFQYYFHMFSEHFSYFRRQSLRGLVGWLPWVLIFVGFKTIFPCFPTIFRIFDPNLFVGWLVGWPWVFIFVGFKITFTCFPAQQRVGRDRKHLTMRCKARSAASEDLQEVHSPVEGGGVLPGCC